MKPKKIQYEEITNLKQLHPELVVHDKIDLAIDELYDIAYPAQKDSKQQADVDQFGEQLTSGKANRWGSWFYYPWINTLVHVPPVKEFRALRTSRNRNLITAEEQLKLYDATILIVGMSVGSNVVEALVSQGVGGKFILVDMDIIEPSNLNRIRSPYHHVGLHKVDAVSRKIWEIDPYIEVVGYMDGLNEENIKLILEHNQVDIIIDEMDELRMKVILRQEAKNAKLPVIMAADDGDNALVDIERYDLEASTPIFNGQIPEEIINRLLSDKIARAELGMIIGRYFVGADNIPLRMYQSLAEVGKSLPSWPQLGGAAALSGVTLTYVARKILLGSKIKDGRALVSLDEKLDLEHDDISVQEQLQQFRSMIEGGK
ncbi:MAG: ThiF family adenylyltransferase [Candidatus Saccharimonadales bacterium]